MPGRAVGHFDDYASQAAKVRAVLREAGIPSHVVVKHPDPEPEPPPVQRPSECCVMVPGDLGMQATSVIEREISTRNTKKSGGTTCRPSPTNSFAP